MKITVEEARKRGLRFYFTGVPCRRGHVSPRHVKNHTCKECQRLAAQNWERQNRERRRQKRTLWARANPRAVGDRDAVIAQATPEWVDWEIMGQIYLSRDETEQVDHYYPLRHSEFSGLNVPWNLQVITAEENSQKSNKRPEEFYDLEDGDAAQKFYDQVRKPHCLRETNGT